MLCGLRHRPLRVSSATVGSRASSYDGEGRRFSKTHTTAGGATADRLYLAPGFEVDVSQGQHERHFFARGRRLATVRRSGLGTSSDPWDVANEVRRNYHSDQVNTNQIVTDGNGDLVQRTVHTPYGRQHVVLDGVGSPLPHSPDTIRQLFTDQEYDPETELSYFGARYYDPAIGRFLSFDPASRSPPKESLPGPSVGKASESSVIRHRAVSRSDARSTSEVTCNWPSPRRDSRTATCPMPS